MRLAGLGLVAPVIIMIVLMVIPELEWEAAEFHFYVVSAASLMAALVCGVLVLSARPIRETRILFLALSFMALATLFSVHGLTTPGHFYDEPSAVLKASPWVSTFAAATFAVLSVLTAEVATGDRGVRFSGVVFVTATVTFAAFLGVSLAFPNWLSWLPTQNETFPLWSNRGHCGDTLLRGLALLPVIPSGSARLPTGYGYGPGVTC